MFVDSVVAQNGSPVDDDYKLYKGIMFPNEKATLVFHQHALSLNQLSALWLRLYDENDGSLVAIDNRPADNVQQVAAESITGPWVEAVLKVHSVGDYFHDEDDEEYALATEEHFVRANPPILSYTQPWPEWMGPAASWQHTVTVFNDGDVAAHNVEVTVGAVAGVSGTGTVSIGTVAAGGSATADFSFQVTATLEGAFTVPVDINSDSYGENYHHGVETGLLFLIDSVPPSTACSVPGFVPGDSVQVDWEADDDASGISHVVVYFKGPGDTEFTSYLGISDATSGSWNQIFDGRDGLWHFAVQATDNSGNIEPLPTEAECSTLRVSLAP